MVRLQSGGDVRYRLHREPWALPREAEIQRQSGLCSDGHFVTPRPPPESSKDGQSRACDSHWLLAQRLLSHTGGKKSGESSLRFSGSAWVVESGFLNLPFHRSEATQFHVASLPVNISCFYCSKETCCNPSWTNQGHACNLMSDDLGLRHLSSKAFPLTL